MLSTLNHMDAATFKQSERQVKSKFTITIKTKLGQWFSLQLKLLQLSSSLKNRSFNGTQSKTNYKRILSNIF